MCSSDLGVARGLFDVQAVEAFNAELGKAIERQGGPKLDAVYYCPHLSDGQVAAYKKACNCRKPEPGMILEAASAFPDPGTPATRKKWFWEETKLARSLLALQPKLAASANAQHRVLGNLTLIPASERFRLAKP